MKCYFSAKHMNLDKWHQPVARGMRIKITEKLAFLRDLHAAGAITAKER